MFLYVSQDEILPFAYSVHQQRRRFYIFNIYVFFRSTVFSIFSTSYMHCSKKTYFKISVVIKIAWIYLWKLTTAGKIVQKCFHSKHKGYWWLFFNAWDKISDCNYSNTSSYIYHENLLLQWMLMKWIEFYRMN